MEMLAAAGVNSFKFFMAYKGALQVSDEQMIAGFRKCKSLGAIAQVIAEHNAGCRLWLISCFTRGHSD
jgi:dihydropyrimidinase